MCIVDTLQIVMIQLLRYYYRCTSHIRVNTYKIVKKNKVIFDICNVMLYY